MEERVNIFAKQVETFINSTSIDYKGVAKKMTQMHRYLVNQWFKVVLRFIGFLAKNYEEHLYDDRNEYACRVSKQIIDNLRENYEWVDDWIND